MRLRTLRICNRYDRFDHLMSVMPDEYSAIGAAVPGIDSIEIDPAERTMIWYRFEESTPKVVTDIVDPRWMNFSNAAALFAWDADSDSADFAVLTSDTFKLMVKTVPRCA